MNLRTRQMIVGLLMVVAFVFLMGCLDADKEKWSLWHYWFFKACLFVSVINGGYLVYKSVKEE